MGSNLQKIEIFEKMTSTSTNKIFENLDFWTFDHCILYSFLPGFSLWQRGIDSTKQMMVYDQITSFLIFRFFCFCPPARPRGGAGGGKRGGRARNERATSGKLKNLGKNSKNSN